MNREGEESAYPQPQVLETKGDAKGIATLNKELVFLILQFLYDEGFTDTAHALERESGFFFDLEYFEDNILSGNWNELESYLSGFTKVDDNRYSTKIYFEIRKQNFIEALDKNDRVKALNILMKDLKVFAPVNNELFKEMTLLLTMDNIRQHESLSNYTDAKSAREIIMLELKKIIEANPIFNGKLKFPNIENNRLRRLVNQGLNWQHILCKHPHSNPDVKSLFVDHICQLQHDVFYSQSTENDSLVVQATSVPNPSSRARWSASTSTLSSSAVSGGAISSSGPKNFGVSAGDFEDSVIMSRREFTGIPLDVMSTVTLPGQSYISLNIPDDLPRNHAKDSGLLSNSFPRTVAQILDVKSSPTSMDFHPVKQGFLLVGTSIGDIGLWEVNSGKKIFSRNFKVWNIGECSVILKATLVKDPHVSVNRISWSPSGSFFGVAYSKHIVQLYSYSDANDINQQFEIDAHLGGVNDLAFSTPHNRLLVITGGDDKTIKAWDAATGVRIHTFKGHDAPIYSLCPHSKSNVHFIFSTSVDGKIKAWLYDNLGARVDFEVPGLGCATMAYSANNRLFSCGTCKDGKPFLVEWNESEGAIKRAYQGLQKRSLGKVQFDTYRNNLLAVGDDHLVKIWDMNKAELFVTIDANGDLLANPLIRFNKEGTLLAVFANESRIKILATDYGLQTPHKSGDCSSDAPKVLPDCVEENVDFRNQEKEKFESNERTIYGSMVQKLFHIENLSQCQHLLLSTHGKAIKISRLIYTNSGNAILALASNAIHFIWKWLLSDLNLSGKATTKLPPKLWRPRNCERDMINELTGSNPAEAVPCFALSKNDAYLMSASGGVISLFNMTTFKIITTFMRPSPAASCLAFYPQDNNVIAIGMDDSTILIYNVRFDKIKGILNGHSEKVTGLAFSKILNVLVSSGADRKIFVWNADSLEKQKNRSFEVDDAKTPANVSECHIQFHLDQTQFLVAYGTHLAIYEAKGLECLKQWVPKDSVPISQATFSCNGDMVYASFVDGTLSVFDASNLELRCRIFPTAYLPPGTRAHVYPHAIAAHPQKPTQFAVGLTDGTVVVLEPEEASGKWSMLPPDKAESSNCVTEETSDE